MSDHNINVIDRDGATHTIEWEAEQSLMEAIRDNDLPILASCGGTESCATCHVYMPEGLIEELDPRSDDEIELLEEAEGFQPGCSRLSCQIPYRPSFLGMTVTLAPEDD